MPPQPIYLFHGDDTYGLAEAQRKLEASLLDPAWAEFNRTTLPPDTPAARLVEAVVALPFGAGKRLVVMRDPAFLAGKSEDPTLGELEKLIERGLPESSALLLVTAKADSRLKLVKAIAAAGTVREFAASKPWQREEQLGPWAAERLAGLKRQATPEALRLLVTGTGGDRARLASELEKLSLYVPEGTRVDAEHVRALVGGGEVEVFALTDALAAKDAGGALGALSKLLTTEHPLKVLAAVATIVRGWHRLKTLAAEGLSPQAIAQATGARSDFKIKKDLAAIRAWSVSELASALKALLALDLAVKTGQWPPEHHRALWEKTLCDMLSAPGGSRVTDRNG